MTISLSAPTPAIATSCSSLDQDWHRSGVPADGWRAGMTVVKDCLEMARNGSFLGGLWYHLTRREGNPKAEFSKTSRAEFVRVQIIHATNLVSVRSACGQPTSGRRSGVSISRVHRGTRAWDGTPPGEGAAMSPNWRHFQKSRYNRHLSEEDRSGRTFGKSDAANNPSCS
jgi:hypothetical protein